ncbi:MAG: hypothetical protein AAB482_02315 [Patescibacteria group bacterium]
MVGGKLGFIKNLTGAGFKTIFSFVKEIGALFILAKIGLAACAPSSLGFLSQGWVKDCWLDFS